MNHCYRLVFNVARQAWQAVAETAKTRTKSGKVKSGTIKSCNKTGLYQFLASPQNIPAKAGYSCATAACLLACSGIVSQNVLAETAANALPTGGQVVYGQSSISQNGNQLNILQSTQKSIINWGSYNIGANSTVNYVQPNASAISLNRVIGQDPSAIFGKLNANGQVWLINPNGILFGQSAQVNVGGLLASTLNISDDDFLSSNYQFSGSSGSIVNQGEITAQNGGYVAMFSPEIRNEGIITALEGASVLASGDAVLMSFNNSGLMNVQIDSANINTLIENKNLIRVGGGQVLMSSKAADSLMTSVINNTGRIEADSMVNDGGVIRLTGAKTVINSGEISAKSTAGKGGSVHLLGENVGVFNNGSINVNGKTGGGTILLGGDFQGSDANIQNAQKTFISQNAKLSADATEYGDGGKVIVWADDTTRFYGSISAKGGNGSGNGGFVEVSGKNYLDFIGQVDTTAQFGNIGVLLLDPTDITISTGANTIETTGATTFQEATPTATSILNTTTLQNALALNNVTVTTASAAAGTGNIAVNSTVSWTSGRTLTLLAENNLTVAAAITTTGAGGVVLRADSDNSGAGTLAVNAAIATDIGGAILSGASITSTAAGTINTTGAANANGGNVSIAATGAVTLAGAIISTGGTAGAGNVGRNAGTVNISGVSVQTAAITANGSNGNGTNQAAGNTGAITLTAATGNVTTTGALTARTGSATGTGASGAPATISVSGANVTLAAVNVSGQTKGNGGNISATVTGVLTLNGALNANGGTTVTGNTGRNAGNINLAGNTITAIAAGTIVASGSNGLGANQAGGNAGTVTINGAGAFSLRAITASGGSGVATNGGGGNAGVININSSAGAINMNGAALTARNGNALGAGTAGAAGSVTVAGTAVTLGAVTTAGNSKGNGGSITASASTGALTLNGAINSNGGAGVAGTVGGNAGAVNLTGNSIASAAAGAVTATGGAGGANAGGGTGALVTINSTNNASLRAVTASGGNGAATGGAGGAAGSINITSSAGIVNTNTAALTARTGVANGAGASGAAGSVNVTGAGVTIGAINTSRGSASGTGGNVNLTTTGAATSTVASINADTLGAINTNVADTLTVSGVIAGTNSVLTKNGAGTLVLGGANTYTGATNINAGTLTLNATGTIAASAGVANNGTFSIAANKTIDSMTGAGNTVLGANTLTIGDASNTSSTYNGVISGTGGLTKAGTGALTLGGASTYTGATAINAGTLVASNANALGGAGGGTTVASGATLNVNNLTLAESALSINGTGVSGAGALTGTGAALVSGTVTTTGASNIGTTSIASTLTLNGVTTATAGNLGIVGAGDIVATNAGNNFGTVNINGAKNVSLRDTNAITIGNGASSLTGNLTVQAGSDITVANNIASTGGDITLAGVNFINTAGASALSASGRWLVYSTAPADDTFGGLLSGNQAIWNTAYPAAVSQTGNRYVFTNAPTLTVTSTNQTKTYGQDGAPIVANAYTVTGFVDAATFGNVFTQDTAGNTVTGNATSTGSATTASVAGGPYAISVAAITATTGYTLIKNSTGNLTVNQAALTVTANNQTKTYGNTFTFAGTEFTNSALQNGESIGSVTMASVGAVNTANVNAYAITASNATGGTFDAANYVITYVDGSMTVDPATINLSGARTYNGTTAFNSADFGVINGVLSQTLNLTGAGSVASANAGAAQTLTLDTIALTNGTGLASNYTLTGGTHTGTINQANLTISTSDVTKTYNGTLAAAGTAIVTNGTLFNNASNGGALDAISGGSFAYTNANAGVGNKIVTTTGVTVADGNAGGNYNVTYANNTTSTINKADITISTSDVVKTYDGAATAAGTATVASGTLYNNASNGNALDNLSGGDFAFTDKNFGLGNKTVTVGNVTVNDGNGGGNYNVLYANNTTSTINKAALTLNAVTDTKTYDGNTNSTGVVGIVGLQVGDSVTAAQSFDNKNAGSRTLGVNSSFAISDGNGGANYTVTTNTAAGTIDQKALTVTANNQTKTYGQTVNFAGTEFTSAGLVTGEAIDSVTLNSAGAINTANVAGSAYAITASNATGGTFDANNYAIDYVDGALTVNRAALTVTANNASKTQGSANPAFSSAFAGFVNGETAAVLTGVLGHNTAAVTSSPAGSYGVTPFGLSAANYDITFVNGVLTVNAATSLAALGVSFNDVLIRPQQALQTCSGELANSNVMISGLDAFGADDVEYKHSVNQPLVGGTVANALVSPACLKL